jgi:hypothetical protein
MLVPMTYENEDGETVHADAEVVVEPGTTGFVRAFINEIEQVIDQAVFKLYELEDENV